MLELAVFLGNPGKEYSQTRHNAGFLLAEKLPFYADLSWQKKFKGLYAAMDRERLGEPSPASPEAPSRLHFIKPETYMNRSGESAAAVVTFFKIQKSDAVIVVHDELELPLGTISLKFSGGLGGHNGLRSMKASFGTADFWRIRIGIGRPDSRLPGEGGREGSGEGIVDWVLSDFDAAETEILNRVLETGAELLARAFIDGPERLLPEWAKKAVKI
ncbi:MAG: aminoacyl-tRNA hydrolase [Treponema sp.]|nr:aminoacyl-tRNA hydrolase [Treponema sp.]